MLAIWRIRWLIAVVVALMALAPATEAQSLDALGGLPTCAVC